MLISSFTILSLPQFKAVVNAEAITVYDNEKDWQNDEVYMIPAATPYRQHHTSYNGGVVFDREAGDAVNGDNVSIRWFLYLNATVNSTLVREGKNEASLFKVLPEPLSGGKLAFEFNMENTAAAGYGLEALAYDKEGAAYSLGKAFETTGLQFGWNHYEGTMPNGVLVEKIEIRIYAIPGFIISEGTYQSIPNAGSAIAYASLDDIQFVNTYKPAEVVFDGETASSWSLSGTGTVVGTDTAIPTNIVPHPTFYNTHGSNALFVTPVFAVNTENTLSTTYATPVSGDRLSFKVLLTNPNTDTYIGQRTTFRVSAILDDDSVAELGVYDKTYIDYGIWANGPNGGAVPNNNYGNVFAGTAYFEAAIPTGKAVKTLRIHFKFTNPASGYNAAAKTIYIIDEVRYITEPTEIPVEPASVSLTKSDEDFIVGIEGWISTHKYQIWTYQQITSGIFETQEETGNQWILSHAYTLGSDRTAGGFAEVGSAITRNIGSFASVDSNYTVAVRVIDGSGNFVGQYKDTYTQAEVGEVVISKVTVDGVFADDKAFVKDIAGVSPVAFAVTGNGVEGTVYTAKIDQTGAALTASGAGLNEFSWDISGMQPGNYSVTLTAATATSTDSRTVSFRLYKIDETITYGRMDSLSVTGTVASENFKVDIAPTIASGDSFRYRLSEPWRSPFYDSGTTVVPAGVISDTNIPADKYGIYQVAVYTYRLGVASADDGDIKTVNNERGGVLFDVDVTVEGVPGAGDPVEAQKGEAVILSALATGIPSAEYSFWRRDANGWVLIRDYAADGEVTWTPNRVGLYTIQVRAKEAAGLTYEAVQNIEFDITDAVDTKAVVTGITINQATLDSDAAARTPITITANAVSASEDLLYKFIISNGYIYYVETPYSVDPTYIWVPGKAGDYTISVLVKNRVSFGKYDAVNSFTVGVE